MRSFVFLALAFAGLGSAEHAQHGTGFQQCNAQGGVCTKTSTLIYRSSTAYETYHVIRNGSACSLQPTGHIGTGSGWPATSSPLYPTDVPSSAPYCSTSTRTCTKTSTLIFRSSTAYETYHATKEIPMCNHTAVPTGSYSAPASSGLPYSSGATPRVSSTPLATPHHSNSSTIMSPPTPSSHGHAHSSGLPLGTGSSSPLRPTGTGPSTSAWPSFCSTSTKICTKTSTLIFRSTTAYETYYATNRVPLCNGTTTAIGSGSPPIATGSVPTRSSYIPSGSGYSSQVVLQSSSVPYPLASSSVAHESYSAVGTGASNPSLPSGTAQSSVSVPLGTAPLSSSTPSSSSTSASSAAPTPSTYTDPNGVQYTIEWDKTCKGTVVLPAPLRKRDGETTGGIIDCMVSCDATPGCVGLDLDGGMQCTLYSEIAEVEDEEGSVVCQRLSDGGSGASASASASTWTSAAASESTGVSGSASPSASASSSTLSSEESSVSSSAATSLATGSPTMTTSEQTASTGGATESSHHSSGHTRTHQTRTITSSSQTQKPTQAVGDNPSPHPEPGHGKPGHGQPGHQNSGHHNEGHQNPGYGWPGQKQPGHQSSGSQGSGYGWPGQGRPGHNQANPFGPNQGPPSHGNSGHKLPGSDEPSAHGSTNNQPKPNPGHHGLDNPSDERPNANRPHGQQNANAAPEHHANPQHEAGPQRGNGNRHHPRPPAHPAHPGRFRQPLKPKRPGQHERPPSPPAYQYGAESDAWSSWGSRFGDWMRGWGGRQDGGRRNGFGRGWKLG